MARKAKTERVTKAVEADSFGIDTEELLLLRKFWKAYNDAVACELEGYQDDVMELSEKLHDFYYRKKKKGNGN